MKQFDASVENHFNAIQKNLSAEEQEALQSSRHELDYISDGVAEEGLIHDNKNTILGLRNDFKKITGKDFLNPFFWLLFLAMTTLINVNKYTAWDPGLAEHPSKIQITENNSLPPDQPGINNLDYISNREKSTQKLPRRHAAPESSFYLNPPNICLNLSPYDACSSHLITFQFSTDSSFLFTYPDSIISICTFDISDTLFHPILVSEESVAGILLTDTVNLKEYVIKYLKTLDKLNPEQGKYYTFDNYLLNNRITFNQCPKELSTINSDLLRLSFDIKIQGKSDDVLAIINSELNQNIRSKEIRTMRVTIEPEKLLLNNKISGNKKTQININKGLAFCLSAQGTVFSSSCDTEFFPDGYSASIDEKINCEPLIDKYLPGTLLYRFGDSDEWKSYISSKTKIKSDRDGLLEFAINLKTTEFIKGAFTVNVLITPLIDDK